MNSLHKGNSAQAQSVDLPVYLKLAYQLEAEIKSQLQPGDFLESEITLAKRFSVNRHTIRRSIEQLIKAGIVVRQQGKGTQVVSNQIEYLLNPSGKFTKNLNELGKSAHAILVEANQLRLAELPIFIQRYFAETESEQCEICELVTLRFMENVPVCLIRHYLLHSELLGIKESYQGGSLHQHISEKYGYTLERAQLNVSAALADANEAVQLKCAVDSPLVVLQSVNQVKGSNQIVEVSVSHSRPDRLQYQISFKGE